MTETIEIIKRRRCVRKYKPDQIPDSALNEIMECALLAPNAMNQQKWHFTVIQDEEILKKITEVSRENLLKSGSERMVQRASDPDYSPFFNAPTVIIISADSQARFVQLDCALAAENILLAAESLDIASCIMTSPEMIFKSEKGRELMKELKIPEGYEHVCTVTLGYRDGDRPEPKPRNKGVITYLK
ncbi:MAG TPA: nitroreductase family protein [Bacillota bacterium]|nr:nitroreductase family protein [Bacillota bacterium]HOL12487.1 nitroreductase family protein [Bacillota bacterium]HPP61234.1 nitroreductase family protein [Bacillota bacterium]